MKKNSLLEDKIQSKAANDISLISSSLNLDYKKRLTYLDFAKFIGIFLVVFAHFKEVGQDIPFIYSFHLPLFFIITGMTLKIGPEETYGNFLSRKLKSYVLPLFGLDLLLIIVSICFAYGEGHGDVINWSWFMNEFVLAINQKRFFSIWFVAALFISVNICFLIIKLGRNNILLTIFWAILQLTFAIVYNKYTPNWIIWNIDAAMFGSVFVFGGWLFMKFDKLKDIFLKNRIRAFLWSLLFLAVGLILAYVNWHYFNLHFDAWAGQYQKYYISLFSSVLSSFGIIFLSRALDNIVISSLGRTTLVILAFQQDLCQRLWINYIMKDYYRSLNGLNPDSFQRYLYSFSGTLFAIGIGVIIYYLIKYSPLAFLINKKMPDFYRKPFMLIKKQKSN